MELILRDDDLSCFAKPEELERLFSDIWDKAPVHFAVIPKVYVYQKETPEDYDYKKDFYYIYENKELVKFLKKKIKEGKIVVWQHGFTHKDYGKKFELERKNKKLLLKELKEGKKILEKTFEVKVDTLVAPHDRFSKEAILAAEQVGFKTICRAFSPLPREIQFFNLKYLIPYTKLFFFWIFKGRKYRYPKILDFGNHKEIYSYRIQSFNENNIDQIIKSHEKRKGILSITTHYRTFRKKEKDKLISILEKLGL